MKWLDELGWPLVIIGALALGLAPFSPEPHLFEKTRMLLDGSLTAPIDIFDLFLHGAFPVLLLVKLGRLTTSSLVDAETDPKKPS